MAADGGLSEDSNNAAGSAYGTGYCDSQCPQYVFDYLAVSVYVLTMLLS